MKYPTRFQERTLWSAVTGVAILVLGSLLIGLVWLIGQIFGFLQPVLVPLIVAGIIAYLLDPLVRFIEKRGISRLWSVIGVFIGILVAVTLLVAAVLPAIQGGKAFFREIISGPAETETAGSDPDQSEASGEDESVEGGLIPSGFLNEPEADLGPALANSLYQLREKYKEGPIGWMLTETTDGGEPISQANDAKPPSSLDFFWRCPILPWFLDILSISAGNV